MIRRWLLMLSASAAVHLAVLGLALVVVGTGASSAILMDLVADVEGDAASGARAQSSTGSASAGAERPRTERPRRITAQPAQRDLSAGSPIPAPVQSSPAVAEPAPAPKPEADAEIRPETEALPEAESAVAPMAPLPDAAGPPAPLGAQASSSSIASDVATPRDPPRIRPLSPAVPPTCPGVARVSAGGAAPGDLREGGPRGPSGALGPDRRRPSDLLLLSRRTRRGSAQGGKEPGAGAAPRASASPAASNPAPTRFRARVRVLLIAESGEVD